MITELDIWRSANLLIQQHGELADLEAAQRADDMLEEGDMDGRRVWLDILEKVKELQRVKPGRGRAGALRHGAVGRCSTLVFSGPNVRFLPFFFCCTPSSGRRWSPVLTVTFDPHRKFGH